MARIAVIRAPRTRRPRLDGSPHQTRRARSTRRTLPTRPRPILGEGALGSHVCRDGNQCMESAEHRLSEGSWIGGRGLWAEHCKPALKSESSNTESYERYTV